MIPNDIIKVDHVVNIILFIFQLILSFLFYFAGSSREGRGCGRGAAGGRRRRGRGVAGGVAAAVGAGVGGGEGHVPAPLHHLRPHRHPGDPRRRLRTLSTTAHAHARTTAHVAVAWC